MHEYITRRKQFLQKMGSCSVAIIPAATTKVRNLDSEYPYRQDSDFLYLTGFNEPEAILVLIPNRKEGETILFCRPKDSVAEQWEGSRLGPEDAVTHLKIDQAFAINDFHQQVIALLDGTDYLFYGFGNQKRLDHQITDAIKFLKRNERHGKIAPTHIISPDYFLHEMRVIKSAAEIATMQAANDITTDAHQRAMKACKAGMFEYELEAEIQHEFLRQGARFLAYNSIVASGNNGCILHYCENNAQIKPQDLVLIDAGCEMDGYAADITRTFPAGGTFSSEQKALYEIVLMAQQAAIEMIQPGCLWSAIQDTVIRVMTEGLMSLNILTGALDDLIAKNAIKPFYMHGHGHFLGLDVHDVGQLRCRPDNKWITLRSGMVLTVEPGLYIAYNQTEVDEKWRGTGIRIEDNILVTDKGCTVLSQRLPKTIADIEALMRAN